MQSNMIKIAAVSAALFAASPTIVWAQTTANPSAGASTTAPANNARTDNVRTDNKGGDYGWVGLIGLVGLAGLMGRNRQTHTTISAPPVATRRDI